jgi:hypothetical protein
VLGCSAVNRPVFWLFALLLGGAAGGCKSDEAVICQKLDDCHLFPTGTSAQLPKGFSEQDCEYQVKNELNSDFREKCSRCVSEHACGEIQDACRTVCNPSY